MGKCGPSVSPEKATQGAPAKKRGPQSIMLPSHGLQVCPSDSNW